MLENSPGNLNRRPFLRNELDCMYTEKLKKIPGKIKNLVSRNQSLEINSSQADYIESIINEVCFSQSPVIFERNLKEISVSDLKSPENIRNATTILKTEGIVVVPNYFERALADDIHEYIDSELKKLDINTANMEDEDLDHLYIHRSGKTFGSYADRQNYSKAVADIRRGKDEGMIDIFNVDKAFPEQLANLRQSLEQPSLLEVISEAGYRSVKTTNLNIYINRDILHTRGFHIDSIEPNLKGFIYLTDVGELSKGPYCYVRKTHVDDNPVRQLNATLSALAKRAATDAPFVDPALVTPVVARKGDLVISDQSGIHRGIPQARGSERYMAVMRYK